MLPQADAVQAQAAMPERLILVRHAKSSWKDPTLDDHARPLNNRGRHAATAVGQWLANKAYMPDTVLSSDSVRTRETWDRIAAALPSAPRIDWLPELYHASAESILQAIRRAGRASTVLVLGHNPGMADAADRLAQSPPQHPKFAQYPTAAVTVYGVTLTDWSELGWASGMVQDFVIPRELDQNAVKSKGNA